MNKFRQRLNSILEKHPFKDTISKAINIFIITLIILNVISVILETEESLKVYSKLFRWFEIFSVGIYTIEYFLRLWSITADKKYKHPFAGRLRYMGQPFAIIDLLAILPFYLPLLIPFDLRFIRILRLFRIFRVLKLGRYSVALQSIGRVIKNKSAELISVVFVISVLLVVTSGCMYYIEHEAQPKQFPSIMSTMWWSVVTLTTVGYGDVYPITPLGKFFGAIIAFLGIGMFALPAAILASGFTKEIKQVKKCRRK
jgi:voltage-gated potassium channel